MRKNILLIILLGSISLLTGQTLTDNPVKVENVRASQFSQMISQETTPQIIDIRTLREYQAGHINNSILIDFYNKNFAKNIEKQGLDKNKPVYIYCRSGHRSGIAVKIFKSLGFKHIVNLAYGINDWRRSGFKLIY